MTHSTHEIHKFILTNVLKHPVDLVEFTAQHFSITTQAIHKHIKQLIFNGRLIRFGKTKGIFYKKASSRNLKAHSFHNIKHSGRQLYKVDKSFNESQVWRMLSANIGTLKPNIEHNAEYAVTEMTNNVIDHSGSKKVLVEFKKTKSELSITIEDFGVGIFKKLKKELNLEDIHLAVLHLTKGKITTDKSKHSGEGIFFTSRICKKFILTSSNIEYIRQGNENWSVRDLPLSRVRTKVVLVFDLNSKQTLKHVFSQYTDSKSLDFDKTHILIELSKLSNENYISRSQAKRVLFGLEKFKLVTLDFKRVPMIGQGFSDEIFRVFKNVHPHIELKYTNANSDVRFMIKRTLANKF